MALLGGAALRDRPDGVDDRELVDALAREWNAHVDDLTYEPRGAGSYHWTARTRDGVRFFVTVDDLDSKPWLGHDRTSTFEGLREAFATARALHDDQALAFVAAPLPADDGTALVRLSSRYSVALFPFIDGRVGEFGQGMAPTDWRQLVGLLAELHRSNRASLPVRRQGAELAGRPLLSSALDALDRPWDINPLARQTRDLLAAHAETVVEWLAAYDDLNARIAARDNELVVTHGEPHAANLMIVDDHLMLIDWDTVGLAVPERDLWMLAGASDDALVLYAEIAGRSVDLDAIELYRLTWTLADLAAYIPVLRSSARVTADVEKAWAAVNTYLG